MCAAEFRVAVRFTVNGEVRHCPPGTTLGTLLGGNGPRRRPVAIERNGSIVPRSQHAEIPIQEGDVIEIVGAVGGG